VACPAVVAAGWRMQLSKPAAVKGRKVAKRERGWPIIGTTAAVQCRLPPIFIFDLVLLRFGNRYSQKCNLFSQKRS
jgi:hypothetical protein